MTDHNESEGRRRWRELVSRDLRGADFERRLVGRSPDGLRLEPLYDTLPDEAASQRELRPERAPAGWRVGLAVEGPSVADVHRALALCADGGVQRLLVRVACHAEERGVGDLDRDGLLALARACASGGVELALEAGDCALALLEALRGPEVAPGLRLDAGVDVLGTAWARGGFAGALPGALDAAVRAAGAAHAFTNLRVISISSLPLSFSGATASQELAWIACALVEHLRSADRVGVTFVTLCERVSLTVAVDRDFFREIARLRALRRVVARVLDACGLDAESARIPVHAVASLRGWSALDPWTNLLRGTVATVAAAAGGVDSVTVPALDEAIGHPGELGLRMARNTQLILQHESHVGQVLDPGAGSYAIETETDALANVAWSLFQAIEAEGGLVAALQRGSFAQRVGDADTARRGRIARRQAPLTGVSEFADLHGRPVPGTRARRVDSASPPLWPAPAGVSVPIVTVPAARDAEVFERLRVRAEACATPPSVYLATSGPLAEWKARGDWTTNALAAGGLIAQTGTPAEDPDAAARAFETSGARVAVIVAADDRWERVAGAFASALRGAGARRVVLAGKPADTDAMRGAGIDAFIHVGCDLVALLSELLDAAGAPR